MSAWGREARGDATADAQIGDPATRQRIAGVLQILVQHVCAADSAISESLHQR